MSEPTAAPARTLSVPERFCGPADSGNGGWVSGTLAAQVASTGPVTVRLTAPVPLRRDLTIDRLDERVALTDGADVVAYAELRPSLEPASVPRRVSYEEALEAGTRYPGLVGHAWPSCFSCGTDRAPGDGLRLQTGPIADGLYATAWTPTEVTPPIVWASLDCPGAWACGAGPDRYMLLGTLTAQVDRLPVAGQPHVVVSWPTGQQRRKLYSTCVLIGPDGDPIARSDAIWVLVPRPTGRG